MKTNLLIGVTRAFAFTCAWLGCLATTKAVVVNLTTGAGATGNIGVGIFTSFSHQPTGSGVWDAFLRIQDNDGEEEGFNTGNAARMPDVKGGNPFNTEIQLSELKVVDLNGTDHVRLALDFCEPSGGPGGIFSKISLVDLRVFVRDAPITAATTTTELFAGAAPVYAFFAEDRVDLDYDVFKGGNGQSDMLFYLPKRCSPPTI